MLTIGKDAITGKAGKTLYTIFILVCIVIVSYFIYNSITSIIESTSRTAGEQNVAVAVKAKADLENATKELNKAAENYRLLQEKLKAEEELREKNKLITLHILRHDGTQHLDSKSSGASSGITKYPLSCHPFDKASRHGFKMLSISLTFASGGAYSIFTFTLP